MNRRWVLVRGLIRGQRHWDFFAQKLQAHFRDDEIVFWDLPGNGDRYQEESPSDINIIIEELHQKFGQKKNTVLAISLGAMICLKWMEKYPEDFNQLFCINTSSRDSSFFERLRLSALLKLLPTLIFAGHFRERLVLMLTLNNRESRQAVMSRFYREALDFPVTRKNTIKQLWIATKFRVADFKKHFEKVFFFCSEKDRLVNFYCTMKIAHILRSPVEVHPTAGHDLPLDDADWLIAKLESKLS